MTFEFYGWIIEYYVFSISPGHGNSGRGRPESRGNAFEKSEESCNNQVCNKPNKRHRHAEPKVRSPRSSRRFAGAPKQRSAQRCRRAARSASATCWTRVTPTSVAALLTRRMRRYFAFSSCVGVSGTRVVCQSSMSVIVMLAFYHSIYTSETRAV